MVTNINLVTPETENKVKMGGRSTLFASVALLILTAVVYFSLSFLSNKYKGEQLAAQEQITQEENKLIGADYADLADFQERLNLLDQVINDHIYFDTYLREMSKYVLPGIRFTQLDWDSGKVSIKGIAPNFDTLSQAVILLKKNPELQSIEFKDASEVSDASTGQAGVEFEINAKTK